MKQHKWHKEIKAWADGAEIEYIQKGFTEFGWQPAPYPDWYIDDDEGIKYRIKPQPKEKEELEKYLKEGETPLECIIRTRKDVSAAFNALARCVKEKEELQSQLKTQSKEPQYLNVYGWLENENISFSKISDYPYIGKIKLED